MNYFRILQARTKSGKTPSLEPLRWSRGQHERIAQGLCIMCGERRAGSNSYLCSRCQAEESIEEIRREIQDLRDHLLQGQK